ncbi:MAG: porphobilinogen synthase [Bacteroidota bacterium]|nr:porphobilinogen synthase [Bacteroidota bacterium]
MNIRPRRLRYNSGIRSLVRENHLNISDFIYPIFVREGTNIVEPISSMPGQYRYSIDQLSNIINEVAALGIKSVLLFGISNTKDELAKDSYNSDGIIQLAIKTIVALQPDLIIMTDVCVCAYTTHGHCGIIHDGYVDNDLSVEVLGKMALSHAQAGAHIVAPSAMMDYQVAAIRSILDEHHFKQVGILAYSAKYYSSCYGPFREAAGSAPQFGDRAGYQMDVANKREAVKEILMDVEEGADMVMVKPAMLYLDIIAEAKVTTLLPVVAYNVSGEYAMVKAAAEKGWIDGNKVMMEMLLSIKRAGADLIITYFALDAVKYLKDNN